MKKLLFALALAASCALNAAPVKVCEVRFAGTDALLRSVTQLGTLCGNAMLGGMLSGALTQSAMYNSLGPTRPGEAAVLSVRVDDKLLAKDPEKAIRNASCSFIYPSVATKEKFLKRHAGATVTNGYIRLPEEAGVPGKLKFSDDGKYLVAGNTAAAVAQALADVAATKRPMDGNLFEVEFPQIAVKLIREAVREVAEKEKDADARSSYAVADQILSGAGDFTAGLRVGRYGIDLNASCLTLPGSELDKVGRKPLGKDPLAFAGKAASCASASAADCGYAMELPKRWHRIVKAFADNGIKTTWCTLACKGNESVITLDLAGAVRYFSEEGTNLLTNVDEKKLGKDLEKAFGGKDQKFTAAGPATSTALCFKGAPSAFTASERLAATLPELKKHSPYAVQVYSILSILRAAMPVLAQELGEEGEALQPFAAIIPPEAPGGIGAMFWREGNRLSYLGRISGDELKGFGVGIGAVMGMMSSEANGAADED